MSTPATPPSAEPLFYTIEDVCRRWDSVAAHAADSGVEHWPLDMFLSRIFPNWKVQVCLWNDNRAAAVLRNPNGLLYAVPLFWPERFLPDADPRDTLDDDDEEWDAEMSHRAYGRGDREACFDAAITDAVIAHARMDLIEVLLGDDDIDGLIDPFDGTYLSDTRSKSALLAVEALIVSADDTERESLRMLTALRGLTPPTGYTRLT
jgi:hypothetical protein